MTVYLDYNATTPVDPRVAEVVMHYMVEEFGNAGSRTHVFGQRANQAVQEARSTIAEEVGAEPEDVIFTSGATEANNLVILGLAPWAGKEGKKHIVSTAIEHKAVLEPLEYLAGHGFEVTLVRPSSSGFVEPEAVAKAIRRDTALVSVMQVNNETGVIQPISEIADLLEGLPLFFHTDAAQGFGKIVGPYSSRLDMIVLSGHKLFGPKGIGALVLRRRSHTRPPLQPLMFGGGQEQGLRPGTLPVPLIAGVARAVELWRESREDWLLRCGTLRKEFLSQLERIGALFNGDQARALPTTVNFSVPTLDAEAAMLLLRSVAAVSNGSACTTSKFTESHVLRAMGLDSDRIRSAIRVSWSHETVADQLQGLVTCLQGSSQTQAISPSAGMARCNAGVRVEAS